MDESTSGCTTFGYSLNGYLTRTANSSKDCFGPFSLYSQSVLLFSSAKVSAARVIYETGLPTFNMGMHYNNLTRVWTNIVVGSGDFYVLTYISFSLTQEFCDF